MRMCGFFAHACSVTKPTYAVRAHAVALNVCVYTLKLSHSNKTLQFVEHFLLYIFILVILISELKFTLELFRRQQISFHMYSIVIIFFYIHMKSSKNSLQVAGMNEIRFFFCMSDWLTVEGNRWTVHTDTESFLAIEPVVCRRMLDVSRENMLGCIRAWRNVISTTTKFPLLRPISSSSVALVVLR